MSEPLAMDVDPLEVAAQAASQPELFGAAFISTEDAELIRAGRRYAHTGSTVSRDERRAASICAAKLMGWSDRKIARELRCDARIIRLVIQAAESAGKLPAVKDRLMRAVAEVAELTTERLREILETDCPLDAETAGLIKSLWVGVGIGSDKLSAPAPASLHLHQHIHASGAQVAEEYRERLVALQSDAPPDGASIGFSRDSKEFRGAAGFGVGFGAGSTAAAAPAAVVVELPEGAVAPAGPGPNPRPGPDPARDSGGGGGGIGGGGGADHVDGFKRETFKPKGDHV